MDKEKKNKEKKEMFKVFHDDVLEETPKFLIKFMSVDGRVEESSIGDARSEQETRHKATDNTRSKFLPVGRYLDAEGMTGLGDDQGAGLERLT